jgi:SYP5 family syntaxin
MWPAGDDWNASLAEAEELAQDTLNLVQVRRAGAPSRRAARAAPRPAADLAAAPGAARSAPPPPLTSTPPAAFCLQERNIKHPGGGPEASRATAAARRKLGTLGSLLDALRASLESDALAALSERERNRRRDLLAALRGRREQMLGALKREAPRPRADLLGGGDAAGGAPARETDATAALDGGGLLSLQRQVMGEQDRELEALERGVATTKRVAVAINEEAGLQTRLLEELDEDVDSAAARLGAAQRKLRLVMARAGGCTAPLLAFLLAAGLALLLVLLIKLA